MSNETQGKPVEPSNPTTAKGKLSFLSMVQSVFAAIFGIQSDKNRQEDFQKGDATQFIVLGIAVSIGIMITMWLIVSSVLESAGK
ncbi:MAG: DUF2970 domain-containing protein [Pseudomonadales bacterium]|nr:DUF2970 domain-containing protein [Pseudomonadales bacterium]